MCNEICYYMTSVTSSTVPGPDLHLRQMGSEEHWNTDHAQRGVSYCSNDIQGMWKNKIKLKLNVSPLSSTVKKSYTCGIRFIYCREFMEWKFCNRSETVFCTVDVTVASVLLIIKQLRCFIKVVLALVSSFRQGGWVDDGIWTVQTHIINK